MKTTQTLSTTSQLQLLFIYPLRTHKGRYNHTEKITTKIVKGEKTVDTKTKREPSVFYLWERSRDACMQPREEDGQVKFHQDVVMGQAQ